VKLQKKKKRYKFFAFKVHDFLTIHVVTLLELEQTDIKAKKTT